MTGSITKREAADVIRDLLASKKVPKGLYQFKGSALHMLVGSRVVVVPCKAGMSFYGLQATLREVEHAIADAFRAREHRNQIDLEEVIASQSATA